MTADQIPPPASPDTVLALDLAAKFGWCQGVPGALAPEGSGSGRFASAGSPPEWVGAEAIRWASRQWRSPAPLPAALVIEEPELWQGKGRVTSKATLRMLWGLSFAVAGVARLLGIERVIYCTADEARRAMLGTGVRNIKGDAGKRMVREACRANGWDFKDADAADAHAVWCFACEKIRPGSTLGVLPLFIDGHAIQRGRVRG